MLSQVQLESHLWQAAQLLRGSVDSGDFKHYILGLLFYKRLCDVWAEGQKTSCVLFHIPSGHRWSELRALSVNLGQRLNQAFTAVEQANPALQGIFGELDFGNEQRFPDSLLVRLLAHFDLHVLSHANVEQDVLGRAYEYLISRFADDAGKKGGEFYTPKTVAALMVKCLALEPGMSIYDPTCGTGGMLLQAAQQLSDGVPGKGRPALYGQEKNLNTWAICKMNMFLHGLASADIRLGDTLLAPKHLTSEQLPRLQAFDRVIANPPFSLKAWGAQQWRQGDIYRRDQYGCPPNSVADFAFIQHMLASLAPGGRMCVVVPCGVLFREKTEGKIRRKLVEQDLIEAIIALPKNLFYGTGIPTCLLIACQQKSAQRTGRVLFVDATSFVRSEGKKDVLTTAGIERVVELIHDWSERDGFARVVSQAEIEGCGFNLSIQRYLHPQRDESSDQLATGLEQLAHARKVRDQVEALLLDDLIKLGYGSDSSQRRGTDEVSSDGSSGATRTTNGQPLTISARTKWHSHR